MRDLLDLLVTDCTRGVDTSLSDILCEIDYVTTNRWEGGNGHQH